MSRGLPGRIEVVSFLGVGDQVVEFWLRRIDIFETPAAKRPKRTPPKFFGVVGFTIRRTGWRSRGPSQHQGEQAAALHARGRSDAQHLKQSRGDINGPDRRLDLARGYGRSDGWFDDERHKQGRVVNEIPVSVLAVLPKTLAVIRCGDDQG